MAFNRSNSEQPNRSIANTNSEQIKPEQPNTQPEHIDGTCYGCNEPQPNPLTDICYKCIANGVTRAKLNLPLTLRQKWLNKCQLDI